MVRDTSHQLRPTRVSGARAFTLVELLVVIGIIAVLVGILLPTLGRARESANQVKCMANMRQIGQAMTIYVGESKGMLPIGLLFNGHRIHRSVAPHGPIYQGESLDWTTLLMRVMRKGVGIGYSDQPDVSQNNAGTRAVFLCPTVFVPQAKDNSAVTHYSSHPRLIPDMDGNEWYIASYVSTGLPGVPLLRPYKATRIKRAPEIAVIFEGTTEPTGQQSGWLAHATVDSLDNRRLGRRPFLTDDYSRDTSLNPNQPIDMKPGIGGWTEANDFNKDTRNNAGNVRFRHKGDTQTNCLMLDGHVESFVLNKSTKQPNLLRKNIFVPPPQGTW
jgi:prepilin-type N-terminal cleavage/methylation domain-containing protein/prepilin-type processing-associated H-X9-DG protein